MDIVLLICWIILSIYATYHLVKNEPVHPLSYFCAVLCCALCYVQKVLGG